MNMKPFFCFYGGKWRAAPRYPAPRHDVIVEPFAGAAGYSTRHAPLRVVLVEKDPVIAALWKYLIRVSSEEIRRIPLLATGQSVEDLVVCEEARSLVGFWLNKGTVTPRRTPSAWMREGLRPNSFWGPVVRDRIASQVEHIRHWRVIYGSYADLPSVRRDVTWFVDPPYQRQGTHYRCSASAIDFGHLGAWCRSLRGQVLVCEQEGAAWLPFRPFITTKANESKSGKGTCNEALWTNGETR